jgi:hypothetical protein
VLHNVSVKNLRLLEVCIDEYSKTAKINGWREFVLHVLETIERHRTTFPGHFVRVFVHVSDEKNNKLPDVIVSLAFVYR